MSFKEQCEALEEAGVDPDEHRFKPSGAVSLNYKTLSLHAAGHDVVAGAAFFGNGCEETVVRRKYNAFALVACCACCLFGKTRVGNR